MPRRARRGIPKQLSGNRWSARLRGGAGEAGDDSRCRNCNEVGCKDWRDGQRAIRRRRGHIVKRRAVTAGDAMQRMRQARVVAMGDVRNRIERKRQHQAGEGNSQPAWWVTRQSKHAHAQMREQWPGPLTGYGQRHGCVKSRKDETCFSSELFGSAGAPPGPALVREQGFEP
jgi:hypothetical protein